jgi:hypothetical protein
MTVDKAYTFYSSGSGLPGNTQYGHSHFLHGNSCYRITIKYDPGDRIIVTAIMTNASRRNLYLNTVAWYSSYIKIFYSLSNERIEKTAMSTLDLGSL